MLGDFYVFFLEKQSLGPRGVQRFQKGIGVLIYVFLGMQGIYKTANILRHNYAQ